MQSFKNWSYFFAKALKMANIGIKIKNVIMPIVKIEILKKIIPKSHFVSNVGLQTIPQKCRHNNKPSNKQRKSK